MSIKFGAKPIEFERGKAGIVVGSKDRPCVIPVGNVGPEQPLMRPGWAARLPPYASACPRHFPDLVDIGTNPTYLGGLTMSVDRDRPDGAGPRSK
jgi:hypothetical protein